MKNITLLAAMMLIGIAGYAQDKKETIVQIGTEFGSIKLKLYNETPGHRDNFIEIAKAGKYDGSVFHRVIKEFMIQGGGNAQLQTIDNRPQIPAEIKDGLYHKKGALCAARTNNPQKLSSGSQFYIVHGKKFPEEQIKAMSQRSGVKYTEEQVKAYAEVGGAPHLDGGYTVFGEVIEGLDVVDKIAAVPTAPGDKPLSPVKMTVKVVKK